MTTITIIEGQSEMDNDKKLVNISTPKPDSVETTNLFIMKKTLAQKEADIASRIADKEAFAAKIAAVEEVFE